MPPRTTASYVTFAYPFVMAGHTNELPSGKYQVIAEDEVLESLSFAAYRRTATHLLIKGPKGTGQRNCRKVCHLEAVIKDHFDYAPSFQHEYYR